MSYCEYSATSDSETAHAVLPSDTTGESLQAESSNVSVLEQKDARSEESQRITDSTKQHLPDIILDSVASFVTNESEKDVPTCGGEVPNEQLGAADLQRVFERNIDRLDIDGNGFVDDSEIDKAMIDPCFRGEDAQLVAALKKMRRDLEELSNDEWLDEDDGITRADMAKFNELQSSNDLDGDEQKLVDLAGRLMRGAHKSIEAANGVKRELFANKDNPLENIKPEAVNQGIYKDCHFMSPLACLANTEHGKKAIHDMIETNGDDTYTVTFPGDPEHPVTVSAPTDAELGAYARGTEHGIWAAVLEKAYGKHCDEFDSMFGYEPRISPHTAMPSGSAYSSAMELLTGREVDSDLIWVTSRSELHEDLVKAMEGGRPVKCSGPLLKSNLEQLKKFGFDVSNYVDVPTGHVYSVLSYDKDTKMLTIRNPWGYQDGTDDGVFQVSLEQFKQNFTNVSYGQ